GASGAVDGADDGDVVARAVAVGLRALRPAVVAHPIARLGRGWRRRAVATKGVVTLERIRTDIMQMHMAARRDVLARGANDLAVLVNRFALFDIAESELVP